MIDQIEKEERALKAEQLKKGGSKELQNQDNFLKQESEIEFQTYMAKEYSSKITEVI